MDSDRQSQFLYWYSTRTAQNYKLNPLSVSDKPIPQGPGSSNSKKKHSKVRILFAFYDNRFAIFAELLIDGPPPPVNVWVAQSLPYLAGQVGRAVEQEEADGARQVRVNRRTRRANNCRRLQMRLMFIISKSATKLLKRRSAGVFCHPLQPRFV